MSVFPFLATVLFAAFSSAPDPVDQLAEFSRETHSRILFTRNWNQIGYIDAGAIHWIYPSIDPRTHQVPDTSNGIAQPVLSPDGKKVAYQKVRSTQDTGVCIFDITTQGESCPKVLAQADAAAWSPDSMRLATIMSALDINIFSLADQTTKTLHDAEYHPDGTYSHWVHYPITWSPDGTQIAFEASLEIPLKILGETTSKQVVFVFNTTTNRLMRVADGGKPAWLSSGRLAYVSQSLTEVWNCQADGTDKQRLFKNPNEFLFSPVEQWFPLVWSPNQQKVILQEIVGESADLRLFLYDPNQKQLKKILHGWVTIAGWHQAEAH
jgi:Tol biopolymer transport system component